VMLFGGFAPAIYSSRAANHGSIASSSSFIVVAGCFSLAAISIAKWYPRREQTDLIAV
jgi:hypothetical protein